eukprot:jgi/Antlo1/1394/1237
MIETEISRTATEHIEAEEHVTGIEDLLNYGIGMGDILKLKQVGICTMKGLLMVTRKNLAKIKGLSEMKVEKMKEAANRALATGFMSANEFAEKREMVQRISTGSSDLDNMLGGGVQTMSITEVFGEFRTGKTQMAHTLCITVQLDEESGGCRGKAAFIDTEGTFRPERLREIAARFGLDPEEALNNIIFARAYNSEQQGDLLTSLTAKFSEEPGRFKLLVIDSVIALFRTDFTGRGELGERQQKLNQFLARLLRMGEEFGIAIFITNQMMADPSATVTFVADAKKPIGGHVLAHASTTRIYLKKGRNETRVAKIYDSPDVPESEAVYAITSGGIDNSTD